MASYNPGMDFRKRIAATDGGPDMGRATACDCADEFADTLSIEELAMRWGCSVKTARGRVVKHGLGINPAGTWLISRKRVAEFEESLRTRSIDTAPAPAVEKPDETHDRVRSGLLKLGILRSRPRAPDTEAGANRPFRKAG